MRQRYRSWAERRAIIRSIIAETNPQPLQQFQLSKSEEAYFRDLASKAVAALAIRSSAFKGYYKPPIAKPFGLVVRVSALTSAIATLGAAYLIWHQQRGGQPDPLLASCATITVAAVGWALLGWIAHRNTVRQNTNAILFARFSQAPFGEAIHRFHKQFGWKLNDPVTSETLEALRRSGDENGMRAAAAAVYILNYFESISSGVLNGDLDHRIVRDNVRGFICNYHDKCAPHIRASNVQNPKAYEHLIKLRTHYLEP